MNKYPRIAPITSTVALGTMQVTSGAVRITDPCYGMDTWCAGQADAKNGTWRAETGYTKDSFDIKYLQDHIDRLKAELEEAKAVNSISASYRQIELDKAQKYLDEYTGRVAFIRITHDSLPEAVVDINTMTKSEIDVGVDSGQAGFCDLEGFKALQMWQDDGEGRENYRRVGDLTCRTPHSAGILDNQAAFSSSGWGDGSYTCYARTNEAGENVEFVIVFLSAGDEEDYDGEEDEELNAAADERMTDAKVA